MDVLIVAPQPVFTPRGTPLSVYHRADVASELGVTSVLLTYEDGADPDIEGLQVVRIPRLPFLAPAVTGPSWGKVVRDLMMIFWTVGLLIRFRPSVVHAHEEAVFWCRWLKVPFRYRLIYDMHSSLPQQLSNFEFTESTLLIGLFRVLERSALRGSDAVITISPALARYATERMPDPGRHALIENSILDPVRLRGRPEDRTELSEPRTFPGAGGPVVFYAGSFEPYQGIDLLIRSFARARRAAPRATLVLAGGTEDQIRRYVDVVDEVGLDSGVVFLGRVPQTTVRWLASQADVVTSPRTTGTNTPLKVYELLACGRPLVATRIPSHTQVLDPSVCFLADPNPEAMAGALVRALHGGPAALERARAARKLFEERYSKAAYVARMREVLESVGLRTVASSRELPPVAAGGQEVGGDRHSGERRRPDCAPHRS